MNKFSSLRKIYQEKLLEVAKKKELISIEDLKKKIINKKKFRDFTSVLSNKNEIGVVAEIKRSSPSNGVIRKNANIVEIAKEYELAGAKSISVLTDEKYFDGNINYIPLIKKNTNLPVLRKDFIVDPYQVVESKAYGADCILLIMSMLEEQDAILLENLALEYNLDVLIEIHDFRDLEKALKLKSKLIGINNRNLRTLEIDIQNTIALSKKIPPFYQIISESGINGKKDLDFIRTNTGINNFLIGTYLMKSSSIKKSLRELITTN